MRARDVGQQNARALSSNNKKTYHPTEVGEPRSDRKCECESARARENDEQAAKNQQKQSGGALKNAVLNGARRRSSSGARVRSRRWTCGGSRPATAENARVVAAKQSLKAANGPMRSCCSILSARNKRSRTLKNVRKSGSAQMTTTRIFRAPSGSSGGVEQRRVRRRALACRKMSGGGDDQRRNRGARSRAYRPLARTRRSLAFFKSQRPRSHDCRRARIAKNDQLQPTAVRASEARARATASARQHQ